MKIRYLRRALAQLNSIYTFAARDDPDAGAFQQRVQTAIETLSASPSPGTPADEAGLLVFTEPAYKFRVFYTSTPDEIIILRILFRAREPRAGRV